MRPKSDSKYFIGNGCVSVGTARGNIRARITAVFVLLAVSLILVAAGECADVSLGTARQVATQKLLHHIALYGNWNDSMAPTVESAQTIEKDGVIVAYNFVVHPSGHILVAVDDALSPVQLYSPRASFSQERIDDANTLESWIIPILEKKVRFVKKRSRSVYGERSDTGVHDRINRAWDYFSAESNVRSATTDSAGSTLKTMPGRTAVVAPLLTTTWGQGAPYNLWTPFNSCSGGGNTLTGCVATAWAQLLRYWEWPAQGSGSHSYQWNSQTVSADFEVSYDWDNMPDAIGASSIDDEKQAVAQLIYHVGVAADTNFGCTVSSSMARADVILDTYFNYKVMSFHYRSAYAADAWFELLKTELNAAPPRPVILSIYESGGNSGHEVVVDGYDDDDNANAMVHINFGWSGYEDGYYDITDDADFDAGGYDWDTDTYQYVVTNIEPNIDNPRPTVDAGTDQTVDEEETVLLSGSVTPASADISGYEWVQVGVLDTIDDLDADNYVVIANSDDLDASFQAPSVSSNTDLVFILKTADANRSVGFDKVTITVRDTGDTSQPSPSSHSSDGGGSGCFINALLN